MGFHVAQQLTARGEHIRVLARPNSRLDNVLALDQTLSSRSVGDLTDAESLAAGAARM